VLYKAFLCSLSAAVTLRALNPTGTGKLVLFETNYGTSYEPIHYLVFIVLGIAGGVFGGVFCQANFLWSKTFRKTGLIGNHPIFEVFLVALVTALVQYPNPLTREAGDGTIKALLRDCKEHASSHWVCVGEAADNKSAYIGWLFHGLFAKLLLTIVTFGCKVPSGIIIPALDAGAFFGRLIGQGIPGISPGIFAMVGAAAFLAGVSRQTLSLCVIMFELTGELEYILPHMIAILVAKWVADAMSKEGVYDLAQSVLGHPFLDLETSIRIVREEDHLVEILIPPKQTMAEISLEVDSDGTVPRHLLDEKLEQLQRRGLMDAGLVLLQGKMLQGYLAQGELEFGLRELGHVDQHKANTRVLLLSSADFLHPDGNNNGPQSPSGVNTVEDLHLDSGEMLDMSMFVDRTPLTVCEKAPIEYAVEMFGKLGLRYLCIVKEGNAELVGVVIKKRLVAYLESVENGEHK
jgi:chloride channel 3/4/5